MQKYKAYKNAFGGFGSIMARHVFLFVNGVIFTVAVLLFIFGDKEAAIFISAITFFNILLGIVQDTRARIELEKLQMLTAMRIIRINSDESESLILSEEVKKGDHLRLKLGDQVPCDGVLLSSFGLEVSEALLTGESESFPRKIGDKVDAGDIITSGYGIIEAQSVFAESRISKMTQDARKYTASQSPIQKATNTVIKYSGYVLFVTILFVVIRGYIIHEPTREIVMNVGALASIIIPQGLVVITTLLFSLGAASYSSKNVLFQEINATEKLGRIKNLCMDKTGTLTGNEIVVEDMYTPDGVSKEKADSLTSLYIMGSGDSSQTIVAVKKYLEWNNTEEKTMEALPFSSWRQYGAVIVEADAGRHTVLVGSSDVFLQYLSSESEKKWLKDILKKNAYLGKRVLCVAEAPVFDLSKALSEPNLSIVSVFVFKSDFREGVEKAIAFFQNRGVKIRIISGDGPETARAVAESVGINNTEAVITGTEMASWQDNDFTERVHLYTIFARILPEQKVKIIEAFKKDGFTAMIGDGANDALAIKKADLGIAMFDGAPATRQLAAVVLMKNSFSDLPGGVELADNFIRNLEIFAGIFINQSAIGLGFFIIISILGYAFPLTPLNITLINYFALGLPGILISYWAIRPAGKILPATTESFLWQVLPFVAWCSAIEAIAIACVFIMSPAYLKIAESNTMVAIAFAVCGLMFFILAPNVYRGILNGKEKLHLLFLGIFEMVLLFSILEIPFAIHFFNITLPYPSLYTIGQALLILFAFGLVQYLIMRIFFLKNSKIK